MCNYIIYNFKEIEFEKIRQEIFHFFQRLLNMMKNLNKDRYELKVILLTRYINFSAICFTEAKEVRFSFSSIL